ncbi:fumarylacetoacetate hydrolase family protein [Thermodesulfitimonas autotrophica]|uniref:fumarylacetoacetate hydrolase family protein n=1 Tax=Thermodesulfitimonas autotrophica TaxID=1894989 RepID=UPI002FE375C2
MRLGYFEREGKAFAGLVSGDMVYPLRGGFGGRPEPEGYPLAALKVLAPCRPSKIVCVGLNYRDHARELGYPFPEEPVLFLKPPTAVIGPEEAIRYPAVARQVDYEAELAVVIGKIARHVRPEEAAAYILGYTCANDVTARDLQKKDGQWTRAKSFDTFCPLGPFIVTAFDPSDATISLYLNGERRQHSSTKELIFDVAYLVSFISAVMTLYPEDVILTGTPSGVGPLKPGDSVVVEIEGIGKLRNHVVAA